MPQVQILSSRFKLIISKLIAPDSTDVDYECAGRPVDYWPAQSTSQAEGRSCKHRKGCDHLRDCVGRAQALELGRCTKSN